MDIAKVFNVLSKGVIISYNSNKYSEYAKFLLDDEMFEKTNRAINVIGYELIRKNGYSYISKKGYMDSMEISSFINKHKQVILAISILRQIYPRIDRNATLTFLASAGEYDSLKKNDPSIKEKLKAIGTNKTINDEKAMLEKMFKLLEDNDVIEKVSQDNSDKFKILDAIDYYIDIVELAEAQGEKNV